jgi:putative Mn2+ efflux pump MntP
MKIKNPYIAGLIPWIGICIIGIIGTEYLITRLLKD